MGLPLLLLLAMHGPAPAAQPLDIERRVEAQAAIARVYQAHRVGARSDEELPRSVLEAQVRDYLRLSAALDQYWHTPITAEALAREMRRIESQTRMPERLAEIKHALGDDPVLFQECVVRPPLVRRLARSFFARDERIHGAVRAEIERSHDRAGRTGEIGPVEETDEAFAFVDASGARIEVPKVTWEEWWTREASRYAPASVAAAALPIASGATAVGPCTLDDQWDTGGALSLLPDARGYPVTVWTGSEMLVWGGTRNTNGEAYDPAIDSWRPLSTNGAPQARSGATGVWTGTELIVWGGYTTTVFPTQLLPSGARYAPATDTWTPLPDAGAPSGRGAHTAVWTGTEMIVWGGTPKFGDPVIGARYNRQTNAWSPMPSSGPYDGRSNHTALWTGTEMIVWGGYLNGTLDTGERFDPVASTWTSLPTTGAPASRYLHTAVWTGDAMIVWGGNNGASGAELSSGGVFRLSGWAPMSTVNAPSVRRDHTAVWTGTEMIVWGGRNNQVSLGDGGRYDPITDTWRAPPVNPINAPQARSDHRALWTGTQMIVHGGSDQYNQAIVGGARYDPLSDTWTPTARTPDERSEHTAVWTGSEMIVWGGVRRQLFPKTNNGAIYDPALDAWQPTSLAGVPAARSEHTALWTGNRMVVWGGLLANGQRTNTGGRYDPVLDAWTDTSVAGAPNARKQHVSVWTGDRMLIWGGTDSDAVPGDCLAEFAQGGARYDPVHDVWTPMTSVNEPYVRKDFDGVWTGTELVIWGGQTQVIPCTLVYLDSGGRYDPVLDRWRPTTIVGEPGPRHSHRMVWTGQEVLVWGGNVSNPGGRYDPVADAWAPMTTTGQPQRPRRLFSALWMQDRMVVWGGNTNFTGDNPYLNGNSGGRYDPATDTWSPTSFVGVPTPRWSHTAVVVGGSTMIVWGGQDHAYPTPKGEGGRYGVLPQDTDGDGTLDCEDVCPLDVANDADADGLCADVDPCPQDAANDADLDGFCESGDSCPQTYNVLQHDDDGDGAGDLCDVCPTLADPSQADSDADGRGNACDCEPEDPTDRSPVEVTGVQVARVGAAAHITWDPAAGAEAYVVSRGELGGLQAQDYGACLADHLFVRQLDDAVDPPAGVGWFYLVQGQSFDCGLGSAGYDSLERERVNTNPAACLGASYQDVHATSQQTVFGTVSGTLAATTTSDDAYETIAEETTSGSPSTRFSRLEKRFSFSVPPGSRVEVHVEGFRSASTDGDTFRFELSVDGGTSFSDLGLTLPLADDDVDRSVVLGSVPPTVVIRVLDTDRTPGHASVDTVAIDELFLRVVP